jgi:hypothetical protein
MQPSLQVHVPLHVPTGKWHVGWKQSPTCCATRKYFEVHHNAMSPHLTCTAKPLHMRSSSTLYFQGSPPGPTLPSSCRYCPAPWRSLSAAPRCTGTQCLRQQQQQRHVHKCISH